MKKYSENYAPTTFVFPCIFTCSGCSSKWANMSFLWHSRLLLPTMLLVDYTNRCRLLFFLEEEEPICLLALYSLLMPPNIQPKPSLYLRAKELRHSWIVLFSQVLTAVDTIVVKSVNDINHILFFWLILSVQSCLILSREGRLKVWYLKAKTYHHGHSILVARKSSWLLSVWLFRAALA